MEYEFSSLYVHFFLGMFLGASLGGFAAMIPVAKQAFMAALADNYKDM